MKPRCIALTGGIATGKSIVAQFLTQVFDACVIDADRFVHHFLQPGHDAYTSIITIFGTEILRPDQTIDRQALSSLVFHDDHARKTLESILHPLVIKATQKSLEVLLNSPQWLTVVSAPLLLETHTAGYYPFIVVTTCSPSLQLERLMRRDHIHEPEARARLNAQWPSSEKIHYADCIINTSGSYADTFGQVAALVYFLHPKHPRFCDLSETFHAIIPRIKETP